MNIIDYKFENNHNELSICFIFFLVKKINSLWRLNLLTYNRAIYALYVSIHSWNINLKNNNSNWKKPIR